jgi:hypothetical protein
MLTCSSIQQAHREIVTLELHGYLFFGSAMEIVNDVKKNIFVMVLPRIDIVFCCRSFLTSI